MDLFTDEKDERTEAPPASQVVPSYHGEPVHLPQPPPQQEPRQSLVRLQGRTALPLSNDSLVASSNARVGVSYASAGSAAQVTQVAHSQGMQRPSASSTSTSTQPRGGVQGDILVWLMRAKTGRGVTPESSALYDHFRSCRLGSECEFPNCANAKQKWAHFEQCEDPLCTSCSSARLIKGRAMGVVSDELDIEYKKAHVSLAKANQRYKGLLSEVAELKKVGKVPDPALQSSLDTAKNQLVQTHQIYRTLCAQIYRASNAGPKASASVKSATSNNSAVVVPPVAKAPPSQHSAPSGVHIPGPPPPPVAKTASNSTSNVPAPQGTPPPSATVKKLDDMLDGFTLEVPGAEGTLLNHLEAELESITLVTNNVDAWLSKRGLVDTTEPDWSFANIVTKSELQDEQQRLLASSAKRLFSDRELEFISRSAQEFVVETLAMCVETAKHRRLTSVEHERIDVTSRDVRSAVEKRFKNGTFDI